MSVDPSNGAATILRSLSAGERVFMPGSAAEIPSLLEALTGPAAPAIDVTTTLVPGINALPTAALSEGVTLSNPFGIGKAGAQSHGGVRQFPLSYGTFGRALASMDFDTCIVHVAVPGPDGRASLGPSVEFTTMAMARSKRVIAVVNPMLPAIPGALSIPIADADRVVEIASPLRGYVVGEASAEATAIARGIAAFVADGATLQLGLGKVPDALSRQLIDRKRLRLHSGMISDGMRLLHEAGALDETVPAVSCAHVGSQAYYEWLAGRPGIEVLPVSRTHDPARLASLPGFVAVNSALSVDLFGQANLEIAGARAVSGVGGAADFARGASLNPTGISIIGLPASLPNGQSRIVPILPGIVSLPRHDIDVVVTEHGAADLRGLNVAQRGERIAAIAAPDHRQNLIEAFADVLGRL